MQRRSYANYAGSRKEDTITDCRIVDNYEERLGLENGTKAWAAHVIFRE